MPKSKSTYPPVYRSDRSPAPRSAGRQTSSAPQRRRHHLWPLYLLILVAAGWLVLFSPFSSHTVKETTPPLSQSGQAATNTAPKPVPTSTVCNGNTLANLILVSISQRHLWACSYAVLSYNSAVVTGMENYPADLSPPGTYHIYAKETNLYLKGSDSTGSWNDFVHYWMPFLQNQYGVYGVHDATWRPANAFGNISPYSNNASHGCIETPLGTAQWLFNWAPIGTTVTIES